MRGLIAVVVAVACLWGGWWGFGSRAALSAAEAALADLPARGLTGGAEVSVAGFPNRFDLTFEGLHLEDARADLAWRTPFAQVFAMAWKPWHLIAALPEGQEITVSGQRFTLNATPLRGSLEVRPGLDLALDRLAVAAGPGQVLAEAGGAIGWQSAQIATRREGDDARHEVGLRGEGITLPLAPPGLPARIERLEIVAGLSFDAGLNRHLAAAPGRAAPGMLALDLRAARLDWGVVHATASGRVVADAQGRAEGRIGLRVAGWRAAWAALRAEAGLAPFVIRAVDGVLENLARQSPDPDLLQVDLLLAGGQMMLGPIPLGPAPRLRIDG